jgi:predicted regulator of amino acid metabolism with ACT domain
MPDADETPTGDDANESTGDDADGSLTGGDTDTESDSREFGRIVGKFAGSPGQQTVVRLLLERGFSVNEDGRVVSGGIEIPDTGMAREAGVDRRVVDATTDAIRDDEELRRIFENIAAIPSLKDLAPVLGLTVLTVEVGDPEASGIVAEITGLLADRGVSLRQVLSDDPEFADEPMLYLITDEDVPGDLLVEIRELPYVRRVEF